MARSLGVDVIPGGVHARVWAPDHAALALVLDDGRATPLAPEAGGYFAGAVDGASAGARYRLRLPDGTLVPDPCSRFQPDGPFGPSEVVDPRAFAWTDASWQLPRTDRQVLYELHVGTFTPAGTWDAAAAELPYLAELGVTTIELMPVNEWAGSRNWGYDGVQLFAPSHTYGRPDAMRRFVDAAHRHGVAVILDVVYNHFGPDGNFALALAKGYVAATRNDWGDDLAFATPAVREFFTANAARWVAEYHLDGLRLDATQAIVDPSPRHLVAEVVAAARAAAAPRRIFVVAENEPQDVAMIVDHGVDALWNDDFHHTARVAATGAIDGYLHDYHGTARELVSATLHGFLYQGQLYPWQHQPRGTPARALPRHAFVTYLENHDQVANLGFGERLGDVAHPGAVRALTALLLVGQPLPMLFQGQDTGSRKPWRFFVDHGDHLRAPVRDGRAKFMAQLEQLATPEAQAMLADPSAHATFAGCVLDPSERDFARPAVALHRDLIALRDTPAFAAGALSGVALDDRALALRFDHAAGDRLLLVNLGPTWKRASVAEPLLAPPAGMAWATAWSSEHPRYGGHGTPPVFGPERLAIPAYAAVVLAPERAPKEQPLKEQP
jgi:maltooligosyltrehalose trehalohydrolase|nr:alpha-amylase family glycosyl hydrolase [Kofleriaceae bacterium]